MKINGKEVKLEITFNTICQLEDMGVDISESSKPMSMLRGFIAVALGESLEEAGKEIEEYIVGGGDVKELVDAMVSALKESGFFQALAKKAKTRKAAVQKVPEAEA